MKKILLIFLVIIFVVCMALPVFAADNFLILFDNNPISTDFIPSSGNYNCTIDAYQSGSHVYTLSFVSSVYFFAEDDGSTSILYCPPISFFGQILSLSVHWVDYSTEGEYLCYIDDGSGLFEFPDSFTFKFSMEKIYNPSFSDSINSGLSSVMSWIQSFVHAFISGELSSLLTVFVLGICVAALFFGFRSIYKFCWGC